MHVVLSKTEISFHECKELQAVIMVGEIFVWFEPSDCAQTQNTLFESALV